MRVEREQATEKKQSGAAKQFFFTILFLSTKKKFYPKQVWRSPTAFMGALG
jgi:hypothetical protein